MRLKTKLVLAATGLTFAIVLVLSVLFLSELLRQRVAQTAGSNVVMARQVLAMTRQAVEEGVAKDPPRDASDEELHRSVAEALRNHKPLMDTMNGFVRYSPAVQDVSVTDAHGWTLVSTDPTMWNVQSPARNTFSRLQSGSVIYQARQVFGPARVLDVPATLERNGQTFLIVHIGVRSTFLEDNYAPWLRYAFLFALLAAGGSMVAAALIAAVALRPIEEISRRLETMTVPATNAEPETLSLERTPDAVVRVANTIDRLDAQMRLTEAGYTDLQANLNGMLDTLRDGIVLFTAERRVAIVSDAAANFLGRGKKELAGLKLEEVFPAASSLGRAVQDAFSREGRVASETVRLEDGREMEFTLDRIEASGMRPEQQSRSDVSRDGGRMGALLTLRDTGTALRIEQELDVSRRLAAIGRLTAGVGHEVKNPINAMVVHLELLRSKLVIAGEGRSFLAPAMRHVDILAGEMERLDRVVQTLADFTRPMDLQVGDLDLSRVVSSVVELTGAEMAEHNVQVKCELERVIVRGDAELLRQAMLNLMLNGMQAMEGGGVLKVSVRQEGEMAVVEVIDGGTGIAPDLMPRIFDLYFTTKPKGSGIGLAMTYRIVQMHGGALEATSEPGSGATFQVRLPVALAEKRPIRALKTGRAA